MGEIGPDSAVTAVGPNTMSALYNAMIAPIAPMTVKGAIWYQGESNRGAAVDYGQTFQRMIESWRRAFANPGLAFYFVQIAPFEYGGDNGQTAMLREAQDVTAVKLSGTGMAVTLDCGERRDIHPRQKQVVGQRLAMQAGRKTYGLADCVADGPRLEQALGNLVDNALRHGGRRIELAAETTDDAVRLHVRDDGPGFASGFTEQAFERFTRGDAARGRGGAGLGLAIVQAIAAAHGGSAGAANRDGAGADVWIEIPLPGERS